jgi:mono/diheme cytochrome c family protein
MTKKVMILAGVVALASAGALRAQQPVDAPSLFAKTCASCHGAKGTPSPAMARSMGIPDFTSGALASIPDSVLKNTIANGKGRMMPSYKARLSAEQITALVRYIRTFARHE